MIRSYNKNKYKIIAFYFFYIVNIYMMYYNYFVILRGAQKAERNKIDPWPDLGNASEGIMWDLYTQYFLFRMFLVEHFLFFYREGEKNETK